MEKPVVVTRPVWYEHFGEYVALAVGLDTKIPGKSINVLGFR